MQIIVHYLVKKNSIFEWGSLQVKWKLREKTGKILENTSSYGASKYGWELIKFLWKALFKILYIQDYFEEIEVRFLLDYLNSSKAKVKLQTKFFDRKD